MSAPKSERLALLLTFGLTVLVDLTVAIEVGVVVAAMSFLHRMAQTVEIEGGVKLIEDDVDDFTFPSHEDYHPERGLPKNTAIFRISGPLFFGVASGLSEILDQIGPTPRIFILSLRDVPVIDATAVAALAQFVEKCWHGGTEVILAGIQEKPMIVLTNLGYGPASRIKFVADLDEAAALARHLTVLAGRPAVGP